MPTTSASNFSASVLASSSDVMHERSAAYIGCSGSIAIAILRSRAYGTSAAIASSTMRRAAAMSRSGGGPQTSTSVSEPSSAVSSIARRLSSMRAARSAAVAAGNMPPRHTLETRRPELRTRRRLSARPTSAILWRQMPIAGSSARRQPSSASARLHRLVVIWFRLRRAQGSDVGMRTSLAGDAGDAQDTTHAVGGELAVEQQAGRVGEPVQLREVDDGARALLAADHAEVGLVAVQVGEEHDAGLVRVGRRLEDVTRQRDGWREDRLERGRVAGVERLQRTGGG